MNQDEKKRFTELAERFGLGKDDFWKSPQGFVIISRRGIEKIQSSMGLRVVFEEVECWSDPAESRYVVKAKAAMDVKGIGATTERVIESYGESSPKNTRGGAQAYPIAMAEKRALARVTLKASDFYQLNVFSEDEISDDK